MKIYLEYKKNPNKINAHIISFFQKKLITSLN